MSSPTLGKPIKSIQTEKDKQSIEQRIRDFFNKPVMAKPQGATHEK